MVGFHPPASPPIKEQIHGTEVLEHIYHTALARCIPSTCSETDLISSMQNFLDNIDLGHLEPFVLNCHTANDETKLETEDWVMSCVILMFVFLTITGTIIDVYVRYLTENSCSQIFKPLMGFSLYTNTLNLFRDSKKKPGSVGCIHGIRFLSIFWVLVFHIYNIFRPKHMPPVFDTLTMKDPDGPFFGSMAFTPILNAYVCVDSFFLISSTLLAYTTMPALEKLKGGDTKFWIRFIVHRYLRLTGVYAVVIGLSVSLLKFLAIGPSSFIITKLATECRQVWWKNLLYINNFMPDDDAVMCLAPTWYLAVDMQFFLTSPIFILAFWYDQRVGWFMSTLALVAATIAPMVVTYQSEFPFASYLGPKRIREQYARQLYDVPWCRFQPYITGLMCGIILHKIRHHPQLKLNTYIILIIWAIIVAMGASVVYGLHPYGQEFMGTGETLVVGSLAGRVAYQGLHRLAWSLCLAWIIIACTKNVGGPVNAFLSWTGWAPMARLSYCIYLCHWPIIHFFQSILTFNIYFTHTFAAFFISSMLIVSSIFAYILYVLFEIPIAHIEQQIIGSGTSL